MTDRPPPRRRSDQDLAATRLQATDRTDVDHDDAAPALGRYCDLKEIGRGGMGRILAATDPALNRTIALKTLLERSTDRNRRKFVVEAQVTGQLEHPGIVPVHELGEADDGQPFFSMKLVRGVSLAKVLADVASGKPAAQAYSRARLLQVFLRVCEAIAFAHSKGVIHRDLKPDNVMVGEFGEVLVMDWGLARIDGGEDLGRDSVAIAPPADAKAPMLTLDGTVMGTPAYMPPEQAEGQVDKIGPRSDVYSLGAILYQILTLEPPFHGKSVWDILERVIAGELEPPSRRAPARRIPRELDAVVAKAMATKSAQRYPTAAALAADVQAFLDGRVLAAADYTPVQLALKWVGRNRAATAAVLAIAIAGVAFAAFGRAARLRTEAERERAGLERVAELVERAREARALCDELDRATLVLANGELDLDAVQIWFDAKSHALEPLEQLLAVEPLEPAPAVRAAIDRPRVDEARLALCRTAWLQAARLGQIPLARTWVGRAGTSLAPDGRKLAYAAIATELRARVERDLAAAKERLATTVEKSRKWWPDEWIKDSIDFFLRRNSPDLVRLLCAPEYLDSPNDTVRLLVIETLGRLGDTTTPAEGATVPVLLARRLAACDAVADAEVLAAACKAIGQLGDPIVHDALAERLAREPVDGKYAVAVRGALSGLPLRPAYEDGGALAPTTSDGFYARALLRRSAGRMDRAQADFERAIELEPGHWRAHQELARMLREQRVFPAAIQHFDRACELAPREVGLVYQRAECKREASDLDGCLADVERLLALDPRHAGAHVQRGWVLMDRRDGNGAIAAFNAAVALDPMFAEAYLQRGRLLAQAGQPARAIQDYNVYIGLKERHSSYAFLYRALAYLAIGDDTRALGDLNACIRLNGAHPSAFLQRGAIFEKLGAGDRAVHDYQQAVAIQGSMWQAWYRCGLVQARAGRTSEAIRCLERAREHAPAAEKAAIDGELAKLR